METYVMVFLVWLVIVMIMCVIAHYILSKKIK